MAAPVACISRVARVIHRGYQLSIITNNNKGNSTGTCITPIRLDFPSFWHEVIILKCHTYTARPTHFFPSFKNSQQFYCLFRMMPIILVNVQSLKSSWTNLLLVLSSANINRVQMMSKLLAIMFWLNDMSYGGSESIHEDSAIYWWCQSDRRTMMMTWIEVRDDKSVLGTSFSQ